MNDLEDLLDSPAGQKKWPYLGVGEGRCYVCMAKVVTECEQENPGWFNLLTRRPFPKHFRAVMDFVESKVKVVKCFTVEVGDYDDHHSVAFRPSHICKKHFRETVKALEL